MSNMDSSLPCGFDVFGFGILVYFVIGTVYFVFGMVYLVFETVCLVYPERG